MHGKRLCYQTSHATIDLMFFCGYYSSGFTGGINDGLNIEWLDGVQVDEINGNAFAFQNLCSLNSLPNKVTCSEDAHMVSAMDMPCFADD